MSKRRRSVPYAQIYDGEPYRPTFTAKDQCCDCGLVHKTHYKIVDKRGYRVKGAVVQITTWRDKRATAAVRRGFQFEQEEE